MEVEIIKTIAGSGGSVVCCVVLVVLFLRHLTESNAKIDALAKQHAEDAKSARDAFQTQLHDLADHIFEIADKTASIVKENAVAVRGLEEAVRELQNKMK